MKHKSMVIPVLLSAGLMICLWSSDLSYYYLLLTCVVLLGGSLFIQLQSSKLNRLTKAMETLKPKDKDLQLAEICHDLRAPLARIRLASEMLGQSESLLAKEIAKGTEECSLIINQITDFARPSVKGIAVRVNINTLITEVIDLSLKCESCCVETELSAEVQGVFADPVAIRRAISNLIANACRYGNGWLKVSSGISREQKRVWICIEDNGPGIKESDLERLLQPYERGDKATSGSGLGLAIVRRIAKQHSGEFSVCNRIEGGLKAHFSIPLTESEC